MYMIYRIYTEDADRGAIVESELSGALPWSSSFFRRRIGMKDD